MYRHPFIHYSVRQHPFSIIIYVFAFVKDLQAFFKRKSELLPLFTGQRTAYNLWTTVDKICDLPMGLGMKQYKELQIFAIIVYESLCRGQTMDDKKRISRRKFFKQTFHLLAGTMVGMVAGTFYMNKIEPRWIEVKRIPIEHPAIPPSFNHFTIVQFSDTHLGFHFDFRQLEKTIRIIQNEEPDLIIFSGDLVDNLLTYVDVQDTIIFLNKLYAPHGKFAVFGNHDHGGYGSEKYVHIMNTAGFTLLVNEAVPIYSEQNERIMLAGIDDWILGKPDLDKALHGLSWQTFNILISHAPDIADFSKTYPVHLQLSGHSHGGQVQFPFTGPLITPPLGQKYPEGLYEVEQDFLLYVNRGLGTTRLPYRFLARPEITVFSLYHSHKKGGA